MMRTRRKDIYLAWHLFLGTLLVAVLFLLAGSAFATTTDTPMGDFFCTVGTWCSGNLGKGIAICAVIIVGIGALINKVSWGMTLTVMLNIAVIFGATSIVDALGASTAACDPNVVNNGPAQSGIPITFPTR